MTAPYAAIEQVREAIGNDLGLVEMDEPLAALALLQDLADAAEPVLTKLIDGSYGRKAVVTKAEMDALAVALAAVRHGADGKAFGSSLPARPPKPEPACVPDVQHTFMPPYETCVCGEITVGGADGKAAT